MERQSHSNNIQGSDREDNSPKVSKISINQIISPQLRRRICSLAANTIQYGKLIEINLI